MAPPEKVGGPLADHVVVGHGPETILFLHGLGGDLTNWRPQMQAFGQQYRCIAWTLPGFGTSPALEPMTWPGLADQVVRILDAVEVERANVVGLSMGGYIAAQFGAAHQDRLDRLILAATTAQFGRGSRSFAAKFLASRLAPIEDGRTPADLAPDIVQGLLGPTAPDEAAVTAISSMSRISPDAYRQALGCLVTWDFLDSLHQITAPTLCLAGADDRTAPVAAVQALADALPNAWFETIAGCNHLMNLDQPDVFNQRLRAFLTYH